MAAFFRSRFLSSLRIAYGDGTVTPVAFRVTANELKVLSSTQAVDALRDLLYAEAKLLGIPITGVNVPTAVNTRDGGVDADVTCPIGVTGHNGVLRAGFTCY